MQWRISEYEQSMSKWQTTVNSNNTMKIERKSNEPMTEQEKLLQELKDSYERDKKSQAISSIHSKVKSGATLTEDEKEYLKANSPELYEEYEEIEKEREEMKERMEKAKSKKEVEEIYNEKLQQFAIESKAIAQSGSMTQDEKYKAMEKLGNRMAGIMAEYDKFIKSEKYSKLPADEEDDEDFIKIKTQDEETVEQKDSDSSVKEETSEMSQEAIKVPQEAIKVPQETIEPASSTPIAVNLKI